MKYSLKKSNRPGDKLSIARRIFGVTQAEMGERLGKISKQGYSKWENNESKSEEVIRQRFQRVAKVLGVSVEFIEKCSDEHLLYHIENLNKNSSLYQFNSDDSISPLDKIVELYERLLILEREKNQVLLKKIEELNSIAQK